jgi:hypothetical protein
MTAGAMTSAAGARTTAATPVRTASADLLLQRKCSCGASTASVTDKCEDCRAKTFQRKLSIGSSNDPLELEADRVADQVMNASASPRVAAAPLSIQRFSGESGGELGSAPASVDRVLGNAGRPLEPALQQDMEQRFGHDFSRVRVHTGGAAEQSARDVSARAYTVGTRVVFGAGGFAPSTRAGRRLIAHELTHVVQQSAEAKVIRCSPDSDDDDEPVRARPTSCPGGAVPMNGVCLTDAVMNALPSADFDLKRADSIAKKRESAFVEEHNRSERTEKKYAKKSPYGLSQGYQRVLKQYSSDPEWKKKYDLETLQKIVQEQLPESATAHAQDVREILSASTWTGVEQMELDKLKEDIKGWTKEEQELARYLLWSWFESGEKGRSPLAAKKVIIEATARHLEQWLRLADKARDEDCRGNQPGFVEKLYRLYGIDRCKPWFGGVYDSWDHGPSELNHFRRQMQLRLAEDETPRTLVFMCVQQYRRQTNQDEQLKRMQAQALVGTLTHVASVGVPGFRPTPRIKGLQPGREESNVRPAAGGFLKVGDIYSPGPETFLGPHQVVAVSEGVEVMKPVPRMPAPNRALSEGTPGRGGQTIPVPSKRLSNAAQKLLSPGPTEPTQKPLSPGPTELASPKALAAKQRSVKFARSHPQIRLPGVLEIRGDTIPKGEISERIVSAVLDYRLGPGSADTAWNTNFAAFVVSLPSGELVLEARNIPVVEHSEIVLVEELKLIRLNHPGSTVQQIFSEREPCLSCSKEIRDSIGTGVKIFYFMPAKHGRGRRAATLRELYYPSTTTDE